MRIVASKANDKIIVRRRIRRIKRANEILKQRIIDKIITPKFDRRILLEYNHYVLKGDLERKKNILVKIGNALEPKKYEIKGINNQLYKDYFYLINNMDIRHNNCDSSDKSNYNKYFDKLTIKEKEEWYDEIYQMGLLIFLLLENKERSTRITNIKNLQSNAKK